MSAAIAAAALVVGLIFSAIGGLALIATVLWGKVMDRRFRTAIEGVLFLGCGFALIRAAGAML
jgi:hypothetical protein